MLPIILKVACICFFCFSCSSKPVEYRTRSSLVSVLTEGRQLPEREELSDKVIVWREAGEERGKVLKRVFGEDFQLEGASENGDVFLRPVLPQHVIRLFASCLKDRKYDLIWDQLFTDNLRGKMEDRGVYGKDFSSWCSRNKSQILKTTGRVLSMWRQSGVKEWRSNDGRQVFVNLSSFHSKGLLYSQFELIREEGSSYWKLESLDR